MDRIELKGMAFYGYHGALKEENALGQRFYIDVCLFLSLRRAGETDDLADTVNYAKVYDVVKARAEGKPFHLIERLAAAAASDILDAFPEVVSVSVTVHKPSAPVAGIIDDVAVTIEKRRDSGQ